MRRSNEDSSQPSNRLAHRISQAAEHGQRVFSDIGKTLGRTAASASELLTDAELRRKGRILLVHEASRGIREIQQKLENAAGNLGRSLQQGAGTIQRGIISGPRQLQGALERVRQRVNEARFASLLEVHNNLTVDVQIAEKLYQDAPQEIRSRLWAALTQNPTIPPILLQRSMNVAPLTVTRQLETAPQETNVDDTRDASSETTQTQMEAEGEDGECGWDWVDTSEAENKTQSDIRDGHTSMSNSVDFESLLEAMSMVPWPLEEQISEDSNYGILIQITIGQDEIDEIISRDIHRTFPEVPHFNLPEKRAALFNILKAYSLHDLEVGYCQGMGFVAGVLLLYLPEEWAFRMLCLLMNEKQINLRSLYVPGLEPLKMELWKLEWLLEKHLPILYRHLTENCVSSMLYASQWFLTCFSCPFMEFFAARVLDFMLLEKSRLPLMRTAFAVLVYLGEELLQLDNFEDILTHIKVKPLSWDVRKVRDVLSSSLDSPITSEEVQLAERHYLERHSETPSSPEPDVQNTLDTPSESLEDKEGLMRLDSEASASGLRMMMSMDLLLDVDVPPEDPLSGKKPKME